VYLSMSVVDDVCMQVDDRTLEAGQLGVRVTHDTEAVETEYADALWRGDAETTAHLGQTFLFHVFFCYDSQLFLMVTQMMACNS